MPTTINGTEKVPYGVEMKYENKFTYDDFLGIVGAIPISTAEICRRLSCCRNTAKQYLTSLETGGIIKKSHIIGSRNYGWVLVV